MANILKPEKQKAVISCLVEGASVLATERMTGVTVTRSSASSSPSARAAKA